MRTIGAVAPELTTRRLRARLVGLGLLALAVAALVTTLPGLGELRTRLVHGDPAFVALAGLAELASCLSYVVVFREVFGRQLRTGFSYDLAMAEQGTNVLLPTGGAGGLALGAWVLRQAGLPTAYIGRRSVTLFLLTSLPNFACAAVGGWLLAAHLLPGRGPLAPTLGLATAAALAIVLVALLPRLLGDREPPERGRLRWAARAAATTLAGGVADTGTFLRPGRLWGLAASIGYMALDVAALAAAFAAFGDPPQFGSLVFAYVIGQLGGLVPLPGGLGGVDGGLIGALVLYRAPLPQAAAAVLAYRAFELTLPSVLGAISFARLRRALARATVPSDLCAPLAEPIEAVDPG